MFIPRNADTFGRTTHALSPTAVLPALVTLHACDATRVAEALRTLRDVYFPDLPLRGMTGAVPVLEKSLSEAVLGLRHRRKAHHLHHDGVPDSGYASAEEDDDGTEEEEEVEDEEAKTRDEQEEAETLDVLRADAFERGYAIRWLTGLVKRADDWTGTGSGSDSAEERTARTIWVEEASRLLARFAGDDASGEALTRTFVFPLRTPPCRRCGRLDVFLPASPITVELNDAPVDGSDHTAVGLQSWGCAIVFSERMCSDPERYLGALHACTFTPATTEDAKTTRRILELGAGTGLLSITAAQILGRTDGRAEIKATDYHPGVLENLARNVRHNRGAVDVSVEKLDWCTVSRTEPVGVDEDTVAGVYDVVLGADVVYHPLHAQWIRGCVERTLKRGGVFWLMMTVRTIGRHEGLGKTVEEAFPVMDGPGNGGRGRGEEGHLAIVCREDVARVDGVGRADEGGYILFEIRWV